MEGNATINHRALRTIPWEGLIEGGEEEGERGRLERDSEDRRAVRCASAWHQVQILHSLASSQAHHAVIHGGIHKPEGNGLVAHQGLVVRLSVTHTLLRVPFRGQRGERGLNLNLNCNT